MPERVGPDSPARGMAPRSSARLTSACSQRHSVALRTSTSRPSLTVPNESASLNAAASSGCIGTTRERLPLPDRTLSVGFSVSRERSETSRFRASETLRLALHCASISILARGSSAAFMMAATSSASRYSGSFWVASSRSVLFGWTIRGHRLPAMVKDYVRERRLNRRSAAWRSVPTSQRDNLLVAHAGRNNRLAP